MRRKNNNVLTIILSIVLIVAIGFGVYWAVNNIGKVTDTVNGTNLYTYDDIQNSYSDGYNTALENKSDYDELIATYRDKITTLNNNINTLNSQLTVLQNTVLSKNNYIIDLQSQITTLQTEISDLESEVSRLNAYILSLQSEIENVYNYTYDLDITFIVDGSTYATGKARNGGTILVPPTAPIKSGCLFQGWSLTQNGTVVDLSTTTITSNTNFYAIFIQTYTHSIVFTDSTFGSNTLRALIINTDSSDYTGEDYCSIDWSEVIDENTEFVFLSESVNVGFREDPTIITITSIELFTYDAGILEYGGLQFIFEFNNTYQWGFQNINILSDTVSVSGS